MDKTPLEFSREMIDSQYDHFTNDRNDGTVAGGIAKKVAAALIECMGSIAELTRQRDDAREGEAEAKARETLYREELSGARSAWQKYHDEVVAALTARAEAAELERDHNATSYKASLRLNEHASKLIGEWTARAVSAEREVAVMREAFQSFGHMEMCQFQTEPHCANCRKPKNRHSWNDKWGQPEGGCKDSRGRPTATLWDERDPLPCNCIKSRALDALQPATEPPE